MADKKISQLTSATVPLDGTEVLPIVQTGSTVKVANNSLRPKQIQSNATSGVLQVAGPAAGATRVMTTPDADFTAARTDAAQTFTGSNTFSTSAGTTATFKNSAGADFRPVFFTNASNIAVGAIGADFTSPYFAVKAYSTDLFFGAGADGLKEARLTTTGDFTLANGNFVPSTAAKGINFTANTPAAGMTSQLLNWYEQGSFTPVLTCATPGTLAVTYATQTAKYQRVGNVCHVWINIQTNSVTKGTASGAVRITGLPFTVAYPAGVESSMGSMMFQGITKVGYTQFTPQAVWTTSYLQIAGSGSALAASNLDITEIGAGTDILNIYVAYLVA